MATSDRSGDDAPDASRPRAPRSPLVSAEDRAEIVASVRRELVARGVHGTVVVAAPAIELHGGGPPVAIDVGPILGQWALLPADMRSRKIVEMAERIAAARKAAPPAEREGERTRGAPWDRVAGAIFAVFGLLALIGLARMIVPRILGDRAAPAKAPSETDGARTQRLARACDAMRGRLYSGASFGPFATEGWRVELWLATKSDAGINRAALGAMMAGGKLTPAADDELARVADGTVEITDGFSSDEARRSPGWSGAIVALREGYARAFLEEESRPRFVALAERFAEAASADHAALYARCAHLTTHDVGAWFRGPDVAGAAASIVYQMGLFSEASVVDRGALAALHVTGDLDALRQAGADAGGTVPSLVSANGGNVGRGRGVTLVFPLGGPTRALAATREIASAMGVASVR